MSATGAIEVQVEVAMRLLQWEREGLPFHPDAPREWWLAVSERLRRGEKLISKRCWL